jgi:SPX domain protein involved in polyphosphate accumulation
MDARETRIRAIELKFLVDDAVGARLRDWARQALEPDPHGHGVHGDEYATTSLYFDTPDRAVFHRRRSHGRVKFRVRRYGEGDAVFLERKLRTESVLTKRRTRVSTADLARLCGPGRGAWAGSWFEDRVAARALGPVCQVSYHRTARYLITPGGDVARVTLDADVRALPVADLGFAARPGVPVLRH